MILDFAKLSPNQIYHTLTQTIVPRPIAWVLSKNAQDTLNLAPFSYFTAISSNPAILMYAVGKKPTGEYKDSATNVELNQELVIHIADTSLAAVVTESASSLPNDESELQLANLTHLNLVEFTGSSLPRIEQCKIAFACKLHKVVEMGELPMKLMFVEVTRAYLDPQVATLSEDGRHKIDALALDPLARLGGAEYANLASVFKSERPK
ncbi:MULTISPECIES: flavin reductase family protein [Motilimonas]|uniref:Flavin reductase family protein n=1 Tax=Motilimonas cestriensis TaxID=2742685 RepID=A0ABS8WEW0_9GAMM|nr:MULTISPECIES: flavin reductase family protein [Motilimonas]MCE0556994.1 flavin reductase family protein [Motilimonas sp. E26]MCE2596667.1 flavin reductase family protein [Motilimonas cestriensis]MDO6527282.1 flavin reductase family protein [Motilimonas sp. 1_MG-2023]